MGCAVRAIPDGYRETEIRARSTIPPSLGHLLKRAFRDDFYVCTKVLKSLRNVLPMPPKAQKATAVGRLIGCARVSTEDQGTDPQTDELRAAGCATIREEHASGADRSRPMLARLLRDITAGDTLWWSGSTASQRKVV